MAVTVTEQRRLELVGTDHNGDTHVFQRDPRNALYSDLLNLSSVKIAQDPAQYLAFPYIIQIGGSLVGIYSDGDAHASSDRQIMIRSDDQGLTWSTVTFVEYTVSPPVYDFSLLSGLIPPGGSEIFKTWRVTNTGGIFSAVIQPAVTFGGDSFFAWGKVIQGPGSALWRTAYAPGSSIDVLLESLDNGATWNYKSTMFNVPGLLLGESNIVYTGGTSWYAVCRNSSSPSSQSELYYAVSTDDGLTWSAPVAFDYRNISGRQPNLTRLSDGSILLATGDRAGISGFSGGGIAVSGAQRTGISVWRSTDNGVTWGFRNSVATMWSTDGGQPYVNEVSPGRINIVYYAAQTGFAKPIISSVSLDYSSI